jgi:sugar transferase (PEP-CTERM/EpsH1 system associated)
MIRESFTPAFYYRKPLANIITDWHRRYAFDVILTYCTGMMGYSRILLKHNPKPTTPTQDHPTLHTSTSIPFIPLDANLNPPRHLLDLVDVDSQKWHAYATRAPFPFSRIYAAEANHLRQLERGQHDRIDAISVISDSEAEVYRNTVGNHPGLFVTGNGVDLKYFQPQPDPSTPTMIFTGVLDYAPNIDGLDWFLREVFPPLRLLNPQARLLIVGRNPTATVRAFTRYAGVQVIGSVPDMRPHLAHASVAIVPLRIARGIQNKVLEAMACNKPVVCSPQAAQGIQATHRRHLMIANDPRQWIESLHHLLGNTTARRRLGASARELVEQRYTWEQQLRPMIQWIADRDTLAKAA